MHGSTASIPLRTGCGAMKRRLSAACSWARRRAHFDNGDTLQFRGMLSPDPLMGKSGYPLLLASGETADGVTHLVDRQHPHDLVMELSASFYASSWADRTVSSSMPACRASPPLARRPSCTALRSMDSPEAPITHHWLDSTHITFGVLTAGWVHDDLKLEALALPRPRAGPAPLRHRNRRPGFDGGAPVVEPHTQLVAAGELGGCDEPGTAGARCRHDQVFGSARSTCRSSRAAARSHSQAPGRARTPARA